MFHRPTIRYLRIFWICAALCYIPNINANESPRLFTVEQLQEDFIQLYRELQASHYDLFANVAENEYAQHFQHFLSSIDRPMSELEIRLLMQRFMALGNIAHANIDLPIQDFLAYREKGGTMLPLFVQVSGSKVTIDEYYGEIAALQPGVQILAIDGHNMQFWIDAFSELISADTAPLAATLIEARFPFLMWLMVGEKSQFDITVMLEGKATEFQVTALSREQQSQFSQPAVSEETKPRDWKILTKQIAWLKPGPFYNIEPDSDNIWDNSSFVAFIDKAMQHFLAEDVQALIIDLRDNPGGTNSFSDHLIAWFADKPFKFASDFRVKISEHSIKANQQRLTQETDPESISVKLAAFYKAHPIGQVFSFPLPESAPHKTRHFNKPVYVLIDKYSYSNAVSVAAILQDYGFATVIGEATADLATTYGAMEHFYLSHTGIKVGYPKALIIRPNGDSTPAGVVPDIPLSMDGLKSEKKIIEQAAELVLQQLNKR